MFKFGFHIIQLVVKALFQYNASKKETYRLINLLESNHQGKFTPSAIQKASRFQAVQQLLINDAFTNLIDRNTNGFERTSNKLYFILTGLYDDIIDQKILPTAALDDLFANPLNNSSILFEVNALVDVHLQLLKRTNNPEQYKHTLTKIHQAQKDSVLQFNQKITLNELLDITLRKGGYSLLMCSYYIDLPKSAPMDQCWYQLGGIIQFTNDLYDIYKDVQEGIYTYPNSVKNYWTLKETYDKLIFQFKQSIQSLPFKQSKKDNLLIQLSLIPAFGYIALENLANLSNPMGELPSFESISRKALIIDMEKTKNRFKLIQYAYSISKFN